MQLETWFITRSLAAQGVASVCADVPSPWTGTWCLFFIVPNPFANRDEIFVFLPWLSLSGGTGNTNGSSSFLFISHYRSPPNSPEVPNTSLWNKRAPILCLASPLAAQHRAGWLPCRVQAVAGLGFIAGMVMSKQRVEKEINQQLRSLAFHRA